MARRVRVTDHALVRYVSRVLGICLPQANDSEIVRYMKRALGLNTKAIRETLRSDCEKTLRLEYNPKAMEVLGHGRFGIQDELGRVYKIVFREDSVVTVLSEDED